jgi:hypothetical protein
MKSESTRNPELNWKEKACLALWFLILFGAFACFCAFFVAKAVAEFAVQ